MNRRFLLSVLVLLPILASADISGTCGDGVTYTYVDETGTLTISKTGEGSGAMTDFEHMFDDDWNSNIESVISMIEEPFTIKGESEEFSPFYHDTFQNAILYVPVGTVDMYKETKGWKEFVTIKEVGGTGIGHVEAQASDAPYYNLNGMRIAQPKKGIYIKNGKKLVIK